MLMYQKNPQNDVIRKKIPVMWQEKDVPHDVSKKNKHNTIFASTERLLAFKKMKMMYKNEILNIVGIFSLICESVKKSSYCYMIWRSYFQQIPE